MQVYNNQLLTLRTQGGLHRLVEQLTDIQKEHTALLERCEQISEELKCSEREKEKLKQLLITKDFTAKVKHCLDIMRFLHSYC